MPESTPKPKRIQIFGDPWTLQYEPLEGKWGDCDFESHVIRIDPDQDQRNRMDTITHEVIHASLPHLPEKIVGWLAKDITRALQGQGYRA